MREILFRGKRTDTNEWIEGAFILCFYKRPTIKTARSAVFFEVYENSVGQYTGFTDKNGKKIFERDILKVTDKWGNSYYTTRS